MYTENPLRDVMVFGKACATNLLARFAPSLYVRVTGQTGRGSDDDDVEQIASYFEQCLADYRQQLSLDDAAFAQFLQGKRVLEYGPGDILGAALLFHAAGAATVHCVDRFPLAKASAKNLRVYQRLLDRLPPAQRVRAAAAFNTPGDPASGFRGECISYRVTADGLADRPGAYELIVSRAVLEHVNALDKTLLDVQRCLAPQGVSVHNVDLRSHNLDRYRPFDFLTWPVWAYRLMYSHKGFPNRWRADTYRQLLQRHRLHARAMQPTARLAPADVQRIRAKLAQPFRDADDESLSWMGFWMVLEHAA